MDAEARTAGRPTDVIAVVAAYGFFAGLWILLSDRAMGFLFIDPETLVGVSMVKGWFFVGITTLLLYILVRRLVGRLEAAHRRELAQADDKQRALQLLAAIANGSSDAIFAKDAEGRYLLINDAAARFVGWQAEKLLGQDDRAAFPPDQAAQLMAIDRRVRESGQVETNEECLQTAQGERVFLATKAPLRDAQGTTIGSFGISRDITERKRMEEELLARNAELERFNRNSVGRELEMIELKKTVNALAAELGRAPPFRLDFLLAGEARS